MSDGEYVFLDDGSSDDEYRDVGIIDDEHDVERHGVMSEEAAIRLIERLPEGMQVDGAILAEGLSEEQYEGLTDVLGVLTGLMSKKDFLRFYWYAKKNFPE